jgi:hypothetical protein
MPPATALSVLDAHPLAPPQVVQRPELATGLRSLDALRLFAPGRLILLTGDADAALYPLIASATCAGTVLVIDGGNNADAYSVVAAGSRLGMSSDEALAKVFVARAFTPYQMEALVERVVPEWIRNGPPETALATDELSLVVINDLHAQYLDEDTPRREGDKLHKRALRKIRETTRTIAGQRVSIVLSTRLAPRDQRTRNHLDAQWSASDDAIVIGWPDESGTRRIHVPTRGAELLERTDGVTQRSLSDWLPPALVVEA